jgi:exodeoxyribonuclease V gamma subunit
MLTVHYSNRLEILADRLAELVRQPCGSPFLPELVIVQSNGMARWLSLHLAQHLGICARVCFPFPAAFIWDLMCRLLPGTPEASPFVPAVLAWRLTALLKELEDTPQFAPLRAYCGDGDASRRFELATRIADVFDQYLVYRPEWIRRWEQGEDTHWQAALWRRLVAGHAIHRVRLQEQLLGRFDTETLAQAGLPDRMSLIGIPTLPPVHLDLFARLAEGLDLHCFFLHPCRQAWRGVGVGPGSVHRVPPDGTAAGGDTTGNRLLASLGTLGRDFIDRVRARQPRVHEQFVDPGADTVLHCLQSDILNGRNRGTPAWPVTPVRDDDRSVQVHVCHSRRREVEVLYDQLLGLFETSPALQPADVVVMTPDIEAYAPLIEAVFAADERQGSLPFSIADRNPRAESPLVNGFFALLDLPGSRYDANRLFTLLEITALQRRFALQEDDLTLVRRWLSDTGVRWGIDHNSRAALGLPAMREHTWRAGLDRLLMGYALPGEPRRFFAEILPYDAVEGTAAQVLGRLHTFAEAAFSLALTLRQPRSVTAWVTTLTTVLEQFLQPDEDEELDLQAIRQALRQLGQSATQAGFDEPVRLEIITSGLRRSLETPEWSMRFLSGGVTFCALLPMRSIPFEVVCLLGMNYDAFPRPRRTLSFDRMAREPRPGDRSRRDDDRYLFLESILSARRCLYLSYVGRNIRDNSVLPPSVLVSELLDTIASGFHGAASQGGDVLPQVVTHHPLQPFSRRYFSGDGRLFSYAADLCEASGLVGRAEALPDPLVTVGLDEPEAAWRTVTLRQLLAFFRHPVRYFLRQRLGMNLEEAEGILENREPFILEPLARYHLRQEMLRQHLHGDAPVRIQRAVRAAGWLPHGQVGTTLFEREWPGVVRFAERLRQVLPTAGGRSLDVDLPIAGLHLTGQLVDLTPQGLVGYRLGALRPRHYLDVWIRHLVLNCLAPEAIVLESRWLGEDKELRLCPVADPQSCLHPLLELYWQGLRRPLPFFPDSAFAYADACRQGKPDALGAARLQWEGSAYHRRREEREDLYYRTAWRHHDPLDEAFMAVATTVFPPLFDHLEQA